MAVPTIENKNMPLLYDCMYICKKRGWKITFSIAECKKRYAKLIEGRNVRIIRGRCTNQIVMTFYNEDGLKHRDDGPAEIWFNPNGTICSETYYQNDLIHRDGGPAQFNYEWNGKLYEKTYYQNNQIHREDGYAQYYKNRYNVSNGKMPNWEKYYYLNGVNVPRKVVFHPEKQTLKEINDEDHIETQRVRIERYGWMKYLNAMQPSVIDNQNDDVSGTKECLLDCEVGGRKLTMLVCSCPSTARVYPISVPRRIKTCADAQKWLKGPTMRRVRIIGAS